MKHADDSFDRPPMRITRRHLVLGGMLTAAAVLAEARRPVVANPVIEKQDFRAWVPDRCGEWSSTGSGDVVLPPPDELSDRLYDNLITQVYREAGGEEVMLLMAYNNRQDGMLQVHRPEVCYPVGGFELTETAATQLRLGAKSIPASMFTASSPGRVEHVMYFTRVGNSFPRSWASQRETVIAENLRGYIPDGLMLRVSSLSPRPETALNHMRQFVQSFHAASPMSMRRLLTGE
ncbi:exosortase-associated protein EpsI, V-type [Qipengyuania sphaerica]|uniref:exosortase-associated protein EpsI, V-type n=1 Tax=Qipengyuania sphaerica TaxID=2867243 RepID=UPI001C887E4F|nr:EpsI family protein [Qipengyuania sphaerica]